MSRLRCIEPGGHRPIHSRPVTGVAPLRRHGWWVLVLVVGCMGVMASRALAVELTPAEIENRRCLNCHGQQRMGELTPDERRSMVAATDQATTKPQPATRPELYIAPDALAASVHASLACVSCHPQAQQLPHAQAMPAAQCNAACHTKAAADYRMSRHAQVRAQGNAEAPTCATCHGSHDIRPKSDRQSRTYPFNLIKICGDCHQNHAGTKTPAGLDPRKVVSSYLDSVHGQAILSGGLVVAATCADCHSNHAILPAADPRSTINRAHVPDTCGKCHVGVAETFAKSIHGKKLAAGSDKAPACSDCHTAHSISRTNTPAFMLDIVNECGTCHDKPMRTTVAPRPGFSLYESYRQSYHGQVNQLGYTSAARCSSCHGAHDILPVDDPESRLSAANRIEVCRHCHPQADAKFALFAPHADFHDGTRYPLLHAVFLYFVIMMSASFGFFGLHCVLWFCRALVHRLRHGPGHKHVAKPGVLGIRRFQLIDRVNHALAIVSFFGLTLTGMPLLFSNHHWARALATMLGGVAAAGILHRIFAVMLLANLVIHVSGVFNRWRKSGVSFTIKGARDWFYGPHTILPNLKDARDALGMFRWFFGGQTKPKFDRWTYWEKFDYMAEIGGTGIIGFSGLMLWFPEFFSHFLPGWMFNIATLVHGYEAMLAVGFIFTIHFFNAHLRLEKFPVDDVMFTGQLPEEEFKEERTQEYERLVQQGKLESLRVPPPPRWSRPFAVAMGILAMLIGTTMVALIILAGLNLIH